MKDKYSNFLSLFCVTLLFVSWTGCGEKTETQVPTCSTDEVEFVTDGKTSCLPRCFEDGTCGQTNNTNGNNGTNNRTNNQATTGETTPKSIVIDKSLDDREFCEAIFDKLLIDCIEVECELNPETKARFVENYEAQLATCITSRNDPDLKPIYDQIAGVPSCDLFRPRYCIQYELGDQCGCVTTNAGDACTTRSDCEGDHVPSCITHTDYPGGYCTSLCAGGRRTSDRTYFFFGDPSCAEGDICTIQEQNGNANTFCLDGCTSQSECREGYECFFAGTQRGVEGYEGKFVRYCTPSGPPVACQTMADCANRAPCIDGTCHPDSAYQCLGPPLPGETKSTDEECLDNGGTCEFIDGKTFCILP